MGIHKEPIAKSLLEEADKQRSRLKVIQASRAEKFESERDDLKAQIKRIEEPSIKQTMLDERRKWIKKFMEMHEFSNVPNKAADFYKQKEDEVVEEKPAKKDKKEGKENKKEGKGKKNEVEKFLDEHITVGPT